jgi:hypothetical protein
LADEDRLVADEVIKECIEGFRKALGDKGMEILGLAVVAFNNERKTVVRTSLIPPRILVRKPNGELMTEIEFRREVVRNFDELIDHLTLETEALVS